MAQADSVPDGWQCTRDETRYHAFVEREYTNISYEESTGDREILIADVQEPNGFGGWGYLVQVRGTDDSRLGLVEDVDAARELALEYMRN